MPWKRLEINQFRFSCFSLPLPFPRQFFFLADLFRALVQQQILARVAEKKNKRKEKKYCGNTEELRILGDEPFGEAVRVGLFLLPTYLLRKAPVKYEPLTRKMYDL